VFSSVLSLFVVSLNSYFVFVYPCATFLHSANSSGSGWD